MDLKLLICSLTVLCLPSQVLSQGKCPPVTEYMYSFNYALGGHPLDVFSNHTEDWCLAKCAVKPKCRSVNYYSKFLFCQLNSATRQRFPNSYNPQPGWIYFEKRIADTLLPVVHGGWGVWGKWSRCVSIEGQGDKYRTRSRVCNNPAPQNGGNNCTGISAGLQNCVDGGWSSWGNWNKCPGRRTDGDITPIYQQRSRDCTNPPTQNGGSVCQGNSLEKWVCCPGLPGCFTLFQSLSSLGAWAMTSFNVNSELLLAFANFRDDSRFYETESFIYRFRGNNFTLNETLNTSGARDVEYFNINGKDFLAVANSYNGRTSKIDSIVYRRQEGLFIEFQRIRTAWAVDLHYLTIDGRMFLLISNYDISEVSIYEWKNGIFKVTDINISFPQVTRCTDFKIKNETFVVCGSWHGLEAVAIFKWNGSQFESFQKLPSSFVCCPHSFQGNNSVYIAIANFLSTTGSHLYRWNGTKFVHHQSLPTYGARAWASFTTSTEDTFLALTMTNVHTATGNKPGIVQRKSAVYKMAGNQFVLYQHLPTTGAEGIHAFTHKGQQYIAVANHKEGETFNIKSTVYIWT